MTDVGDTAERLAWGWRATLHNITDMEWMFPTEAASFLHIRTARLRYWADQGVITCIHDGRGLRRRYLLPELKLVRQIAGSNPTLLDLKRHIDSAVKPGSGAKSQKCQESQPRSLGDIAN